MFDGGGQLTGVVATSGHYEEAAPQKRESHRRIGPMREVLNFVRRVAASEATTILLEGETEPARPDRQDAALPKPAAGRALHPHHCAAIPIRCLESELFSVMKRARSRMPGLKARDLRVGRQGTLFLDEIAEIPLMLQAKLPARAGGAKLPAAGRPEGHQADLRVWRLPNKTARGGEGKAHSANLYFRLT